MRSASAGIGILVGGQGVGQRPVATADVAVCRHVAGAVEHVDALVMRAERN